MNSLIIGVDYGGVLSDYAGSEFENATVYINVPGAKESLELLHKNGHILYLISYCGLNRAIEIKKRLKLSNIEHLFSGQYFVTHKEYKKDICAYLGCHVMIDDHLQILSSIKEMCPNMILIFFKHKNTKRSF